MMAPSPSRARLVLVAAAAALALAAAAVWIGLGTREPGTGSSTVRLEAVDEPGPAPYTASVGTDRDGVVPPADPGGERRGDSPGLYGRADGACDPDALAVALRAAGRDTVWARAQGRADGDAAAVLAALTPLVLRVDVLVDEHGWVGSADRTHRAVLQAGSAVLVDDRGVPRVRCTGGNPLAPPAAALGDDVTGTPWRWFAASTVATVTPADRPLAGFAVVDLETGAAAEVPARH